MFCFFLYVLFTGVFFDVFSFFAGGDCSHASLSSKSFSCNFFTGVFFDVFDFFGSHISSLPSKNFSCNFIIWEWLPNPSTLDACCSLPFTVQLLPTAKTTSGTTLGTGTTDTESSSSQYTRQWVFSFVANWTVLVVIVQRTWLEWRFWQLLTHAPVIRFAACA